MVVLRYLVFAAVGVIVAAALFFVLNLAITATEDTSTSLIQRWLVRATCERYELSATGRDVDGAPILRPGTFSLARPVTCSASANSLAWTSSPMTG